MNYSNKKGQLIATSKLASSYLRKPRFFLFKQFLPACWSFPSTVPNSWGKSWRCMLQQLKRYTVYGLTEGQVADFHWGDEQIGGKRPCNWTLDFGVGVHRIFLVWREIFKIANESLVWLCDRTVYSLRLIYVAMIIPLHIDAWSNNKKN